MCVWQLALLERQLLTLVVCVGRQRNGTVLRHARSQHIRHNHVVDTLTPMQVPELGSNGLPRTYVTETTKDCFRESSTLLNLPVPQIHLLAKRVCIGTLTFSY